MAQRLRGFVIAPSTLADGRSLAFPESAFTGGSRCEASRHQVLNGQPHGLSAYAACG
jgi:hypothetical protein